MAHGMHHCAGHMCVCVPQERGIGRGEKGRRGGGEREKGGGGGGGREEEGGGREVLVLVPVLGTPARGPGG